MEFNFFMPSQRILDFIGWSNPELCRRQYIIFPQPFDPEKTLPIISIVDSIKNYFLLGENPLIDPSRLPNGYPNWEQFMWHEFGGFATWEALKNAQDHSGFYTQNPITFGLFFAPKGVCYGFHDGGDYFRRPDIKDQWENKRAIETFNKTAHQRRGNSGGMGVNNYIFPNTGLIEVDNKNGILYLANTLEGKL